MSAPGNTYNPREWPTRRRRQICRWWVDVAETKSVRPVEFAEEWGITHRILLTWLRAYRAELGVSRRDIDAWALSGRGRGT